MVKKRENPLEALQKARAESDARRKQLLERIKARQAATKPSAATQRSETAGRENNNRLPDIDVDATIDAARRLRLMTLDGNIGPPSPLNRPTVVILREFLQTLATGESAVVLQWPFGQRDTSFAHPLAMLALICAPTRQTTGGYNWCAAPHTFRTLYFPWRGGATAASQASLLVRRDEVVAWNGYHLTRRQIQSAERVNLLDGLHETLGHLNALSRRDSSKPHLAHPTLSEIYPVFVADRSDSSPRYFKEAIGELFGRVRYGAALDRLTDHRANLSEPKSAPYGFFWRFAARSVSASAGCAGAVVRGGHLAGHLSA